MSYTTTLLIYPGERVEAYEEFHNSHGSAPVIWSTMCKKYLGDELLWLHSHGDPKELWALASRKDIPAYERALLAMTYDQAYIARNNFQRAQNDISLFFQNNPQPGEYINNWGKIGQSIAKASIHTDAPGFGIWQTSVTDNTFTRWNDETETVSIRDDIWEIYAELDALEETVT